MLSVEKAPCRVDGPPGAKADGRGKLVEPCTQVGAEHSSRESATLGADPALVDGACLG